MEERGQVQLAVLHWLAIHKVHDALGVLRRAHLLQDALALASERLLPEVRCSMDDFHALMDL